MIWTEEENDIRELENMFTYDGETCGGCNWGRDDSDSEFITCGHHIANFKRISWCSYWTNPKDPKLLAYNERRKQELRDRIAKHPKIN